MKQETLQAYAEALWETYCEMFPKLIKFDCPKIIWNNRLTRTAGLARLSRGQIDLAAKFYAKYPQQILENTLPHELAHFIDFYLNGWHVGKKGHDVIWQNIMLKIGQEPSRLHSMVL